MDKLPETVIYYAETPEFTHETVPKKLTSLHETKPGVWAHLCILAGELDYIIPGPPYAKRRLKAGDIGIIRPAERHLVTMIGPVRFKVEFYK